MQINEQIEQDVDQLNSFLRGELSAVETYDVVIKKLNNEPSTQQQLQNIRSSHSERARKLAERIRMLGGAPAEGSGVWGSLAKLVENSAALFGKDAAISALEEGEDHGRDDYRRDLPDLSAAARAFVQNELLPEQLRTHDALSAIKRGRA